MFAPTREPEFDYPAGDTNSYNFYTGSGGVPLDNYFKRFSFGWRLGDYQILFSTNPTRNTKILIFRDIKSRVRKILPFLKLDRDPYAFITDDGRIKYVYDAYTYSNRYPYSQPYTETILNYEFGNMEYQHLMPDYEEFIYNYLGVNYLRNAVKVFIDAQDGTVENYIVDTTDEIIRAYDRMFPGLFKPLEDMPEDYRRHIRYPEDFLTVQAHVYSIYHMSDPTVFYQREDVWQFPTEKYRENYQTLQPYFVMLRLPEDDHLKYMLMLPFTPQNRNVMNAWMAGQCDFPDYGKIIVYQFPKGQEVYGPQQIEALIDQNTEISASVTLWGQSGSRVIRGNLLTIPLFLKDQLYMIYVEPLFLQAENAEIPEIKRIVTGDQNGVVWDSTLEGSLLKLMFKDTSVVNP